MTAVAAGEALYVHAHSIEEQLDQAHGRLSHLGEVGLTIIGTDFTVKPRERSKWKPPEQFVYHLSGFAAEFGLQTNLDPTPGDPYAAGAKIDHYNDDPATDALIAAYPFSGFLGDDSKRGYELTQEMFDRIRLGKNVDGLGPKSGKISPTAEALIQKAFQLGRPKHPFALRANKDGNVGRGVVRGLEQDDLHPMIVPPKAPLASLWLANTIITVVGDPHSITAEHIGSWPVTVVDGGTKRVQGGDGKYSVLGDTHPAVEEKVKAAGGSFTGHSEIGQAAREIIVIRSVAAAWRNRAPQYHGSTVI